MKIEELDEAALSEVLQTEERGIVVDFWSPWCAPCRALRPHLDRMAQAEGDRWRFVAVNTEAHPSASDTYAVSALPTLVWFRNGRELSRIAGLVTLSDVERQLELEG